MKAAVEHVFTGPTGSLSGSYDPTKTMLGTLMRQYVGSNKEDNYVSAAPTAIVNQVEVAGTYFMPHVVRWSEDIFWVFVATNAAAAVTRPIGLYEFNKKSGSISWKGTITISGTTFGGLKTIRSLRAFVYTHTTGTVSTSGLSMTITGSGTGFVSERIAAGARIGFGTTNPTEVSSWYDIVSIVDDSNLTISSPGVELSPGTPYVIEEIRLAVLTTNTTTTILNGGIHLVKGLNYNTFAVGGKTIPESSLAPVPNTDNVQAVYLLKDPLVSGSASSVCTISQASPGIVTLNNHGLIAGDPIVFTTTGALPTGLTAASTVYYVTSNSLTSNTFTVSATIGGAAINTTSAGSGTHTVNSATSWNGAGLGSDDFVDYTQHNLYLINLDNASNPRIIKFNLRNPLTVTNGFSTSAYVLRTLAVAVAGTPSQVNNGRVFTVNHGPYAGVKSLWFCTTSRIYRCDLSQINSLSSGWISDFMIEIPPGGGTTYSTLSTMNQVDYSETLDRIFVPTTTQRFGVYVGEYDVTGLIPFETIVGSNINRLRISTTDSGAPDGFYPQASVTVWTSGGYFFAAPISTVSGVNWLIAFPAGADSKYASYTNQRIITPELYTPNATKLYTAYVQDSKYIGDYDLALKPEPYRLYFRTSGIQDNSGEWTELDQLGDLTPYDPSNSIQFMIELSVLGENCIPDRIYSISCLYEDGSQDSHYEPSLSKSSAQNRQFSWRQISLWGGTIPNLRLRLFNVANGATVLDDDIISSSYGTWQYSTDGTNWISWDSSSDVVGNYIRYTADDGIIGNLITVRALLTQA